MPSWVRLLKWEGINLSERFLLHWRRNRFKTDLPSGKLQPDLGSDILVILRDLPVRELQLSRGIQLLVGLLAMPSRKLLF